MKPTFLVAISGCFMSTVAAKEDVEAAGEENFKPYQASVS
jgi:hypothetical protein